MDYLTRFGHMRAEDTLTAAESQGIKKRTLDRAKKSLDVKSQRIGIPGGKPGDGMSMWHLPDTEPLPVPESEGAVQPLTLAT